MRLSAQSSAPKSGDKTFECIRTRRGTGVLGNRASSFRSTRSSLRTLPNLSEPGEGRRGTAIESVGSSSGGVGGRNAVLSSATRSGIRVARDLRSLCWNGR